MCGQECRQTFISGHNRREVPCSEEHKRKIGNSNRNKKRSNIQKDEIRDQYLISIGIQVIRIKEELEKFNFNNLFFNGVLYEK